MPVFLSVGLLSLMDVSWPRQFPDTQRSLSQYAHLWLSLQDLPSLHFPDSLFVRVFRSGINTELGLNLPPGNGEQREDLNQRSTPILDPFPQKLSIWGP